MENQDKRQASAGADEHLTEVWGDTVKLSQLGIAALLGIILTMAFYLVGNNIFSQMENIEASLAKGYALLTGILGCFLSAAISAKFFKPKRIIEEHAESADIAEFWPSAAPPWRRRPRLWLPWTPRSSPRWRTWSFTPCWP